MHPLVCLREHLAERRACGDSFGAAWMGRVEALWLVPKDQRDLWREVFAGTKEGWRRAYEGDAESRAERALREIDPGTIAAALDEDEPADRRCDHCGGPIDPAKRSIARFCCDEHRRAAWGPRIADPGTATSGTPSGCRSGDQHPLATTTDRRRSVAA